MVNDRAHVDRGPDFISPQPGARAPGTCCRRKTSGCADGGAAGAGRRRRTSQLHRVRPLRPRMPRERRPSKGHAAPRGARTGGWPCSDSAAAVAGAASRCTGRGAPSAGQPASTSTGCAATIGTFGTRCTDATVGCAPAAGRTRVASPRGSGGGRPPRRRMHCARSSASLGTDGPTGPAGTAERCLMWTTPGPWPTAAVSPAWRASARFAVRATAR